MENEIIVVKQLPIIEEQLRTVEANIRRRVDEVLAMECTEQTYREVKNARAALNAQFNELESRRKEVKKKIEAPYKAFEAAYKQHAGDIFKDADKKLAERIHEVENGLKAQKAKSVSDYFEEYRVSCGVPEDMISFEDAGVTITLSTSEKSLRTQIKNFVDRVADDLALIQMNPDSDEVLIEYKKCRSAASAVRIVKERHDTMERMRQMREQMEQARAEQEAHDRQVMEAADEALLHAPARQEAPSEEFYEQVEEPTPEAPPARMFSVSFKVTGTMEQLKAMKQFLNDGGYEYEQL